MKKRVRIRGLFDKFPRENKGNYETGKTSSCCKIIKIMNKTKYFSERLFSLALSSDFLVLVAVFGHLYQAFCKTRALGII